MLTIECISGLGALFRPCPQVRLQICDMSLDVNITRCQLLWYMQSVRFHFYINVAWESFPAVSCVELHFRDCPIKINDPE